MKLILDTPLIAQRPELPTGCEITAVTMMLAGAGFTVDKVDLAHRMPYDSDDCNKGFVGDPFTDGGNSIFPKPLLPLVTEIAGNALDLTGSNIDQLTAHIAETQHAVVTWVGEFDGFHTHALTVTGFDDDQQVIYFNDCWTEKRDTLSYFEFEQIWRAMPIVH
ncbi:C39 family peptidase [Secundilactobacillus oryzae]|uniref:C39 family peptidase n=1 Tax=Secundilactobacillus oryzae TaxID=1202668 RepID=UPI0006D00F35|nr:C39 family peptidase [Secundilactobacillus oryzae]